VVGSSVGLDLGGDTIPYIAGWGEDGALDVVSEFAGTIDQVARRLETALGAAEKLEREPAVTVSGREL